MQTAQKIANFTLEDFTFATLAFEEIGHRNNVVVKDDEIIPDDLCRKQLGAFRGTSGPFSNIDRR